MIYCGQALAAQVVKQMARLRQTPELSAANGLPILLPLVDPIFIACPNTYTKQLVLFDILLGTTKFTPVF